MLQPFQWIAGVSRFITQRAGAYLVPPHPRLHTVYNPVLFPSAPAPDPPNDAAKCRLLFIGRLCREKGIDLLLEAFSCLDPSMELTILGLHGPLKSQVVDAARNNPRIHLLPPVGHEAISAYYYRHDILCLPSLVEESFGLAVAEARTHGRTIVTTRQGGLPEVVEGYPKAITIDVKHQNRRQIVQDLADAIRRALPLRTIALDPRQEDLQFGDMRIVRCVDHYEALYRGDAKPAAEP
jgi:glycosyltransferase involved in cell wall biosynthesis